MVNRENKMCDRHGLRSSGNNLTTREPYIIVYPSIIMVMFRVDSVKHREFYTYQYSLCVLQLIILVVIVCHLTINYPDRLH